LLVNFYQTRFCKTSEDSNLQIKRKAEGIYLFTKRHGVTSQNTVNLKSDYIQLGTVPCHQFMENATEPCHPALAHLTFLYSCASLLTYHSLQYIWMIQKEFLQIHWKNVITDFNDYVLDSTHKSSISILLQHK
jgi:hypothetical protein